MIAITQNAMVVFVVFLIGDSAQVLGANVIKGTGMQGTGAVCTIVAYLVVGLPLSCYFTFSKEMGLVGIWLGPAIA